MRLSSHMQKYVFLMSRLMFDKIILSEPKLQVIMRERERERERELRFTTIVHQIISSVVINPILAFP